MTYVKLLLVLLLAAAASAFSNEGEAGHVATPGFPPDAGAAEGVDLPGGVVYGEVEAPIDQSTLPDPNDPSSADGYAPPLHAALERDLGSSTTPEGLDWGWDYLVWEGVVGTGISFDIDEATGDLYACFDTYNATNDSLLVYRSTDGGESWSFFMFANNTDGSIENPMVRVVTDSGGEAWVVFGGIWIESAADDVLWTRRVKTDGSSPTFEQVSSGVLQADMTSEPGTGGWVFVTYVPSGPTAEIWAARNACEGSGWEDDQSLYVDTDGVVPFADIGCDADGNVAVVFVDNRMSTYPQVRIKRSNSSGSTWMTSQPLGNNSGGYTLTHLELAMADPAVDAAWLTLTYNDVGAEGDNVAYHYSTDDGASWTYGSVFQPSDGDQDLTALGVVKDGGGVTLAFNSDPGDSTMFSWSDAASPTDWSATDRINNNDATDIFAPAAGWKSEGASNFSLILYSGFLGVDIYVDWFDNTGVEEGHGNGPVAASFSVSPNPSNGGVSFDIDMPMAGAVTMRVYDASGRLVATPVGGLSLDPGEHRLQWDAGSGLAPGLYLCRMSAAGTEVTEMMVMTD